MKTAFVERNYFKIILVKILSVFWKGSIFAFFSPFRVKELPEPEIEFPTEVIVNNLKTGLCGSDISILKMDLDTRVSPAAISKFDRFYLGHENVAEVVEIGSEVKGIAVGDRIVVAQAQSCDLIGMDLCKACKMGRPFICKNTSIETDQLIDTGGGISTKWKYHYKQLIKVPDDINNDFAVLTEPFGVSIRAILRRRPEKGDKVLIYGFGTIGIAALLALKFLEPDVEVYVLARHQFQKDLANKYGAKNLNFDWEEVAKITNGHLYKGLFGNKVILGGFDKIYDCVGKPKTIETSLRWTAPGGAVIIVGVHLYLSKLDLSPVWHQEVDLIGSFISGWDAEDDLQTHSFHLVFELFRSGLFKTEDIISHIYRLDDYKEAINAFKNKKKSEALKIIFDFE